ncbi:MAG: trigger factor [Actinomycetota bacterium]
MALATTSERIGKDQVKLTVEVPEADLKGAISAAYRRWASEVKVPGFRKGKVPRQLIDARVGPEVVREEALRDALPDLYREALQAEDLEAIAPPDIEVTSFEEGSPLVFEATVDVRPEITLPGYEAVRVEAPPTDVTDEDVDQQLERLRDNFAELEPVSREVRRGDHVVIDLKGYSNGEPVEGASAPDYLYEVGSGMGPPSLDDQLQGERAGAILKFTDPVPAGPESGPQELQFTVLLKEVKTKKLPPLDAAFAKTVGEFDSLEELKDDLRERLADVKYNAVMDELRSLALNAFVDAADIESPEKLVESEFEHRLHHIEDDLKRAGMTLDTYASQSGTTELEIRADLRGQAARSVKAELLLEEVARTEKIEVSQEDIGLEIAYAAARSQRDPKEVAEQLVAQQGLGALAADILRRKALDHIVEQIDVANRPEPRTPPAAEGVGADQAAEDEVAETAEVVPSDH